MVKIKSWISSLISLYGRLGLNWVAQLSYNTNHFIFDVTLTWEQPLCSFCQYGAALRLCDCYVPSVVDGGVAYLTLSVETKGVTW